MAEMRFVMMFSFSVVFLSIAKFEICEEKN